MLFLLMLIIFFKFQIVMQLSLCLLFLLFIFIRSSQDGPYYVIGYDEWRPGVYTGFRTITVYRIFTKLGHMIPLWKGKNPIYFGVIRSNGHCYYKYNFWQQGRFRTTTLVLYIESLTNLATWFPCRRGRTLYILGSLGQRSRSLSL